MIIAVDFDGVLCESKWPGIGAPNMHLIEWLKMHRANGDRVILWTCRTGEKLDMANAFCNGFQLYFDAVNENLPDMVERFGSDPRKIYADLYIDDHAADKSQFHIPYHPGSEIPTADFRTMFRKRQMSRGRVRKTEG